MKLKTSAEHAHALISAIPHKSCIKAIPEHWVVAADGSVRPQAVLWLFCWAKTGMNSEDARIAALQIFDEIFPISFAALDGVIEHEYARENRYTARDIEMEFAAKLGQLIHAGSSPLHT
jgi:hypothetical protein